jgi:hypothetical protein
MGCFIDTTLIVAVAEEQKTLIADTLQHAALNAPAEVPHYALREFLAGVINTICNAHNRLLDSENPAEAFLSVLSLPTYAGRTRDGQIKALADALGNALSTQTKANNEPKFIGVRRDMCHHLLLTAQRQWKRAKSIKPFIQVQPLGCFIGGDLDLDEKGYVVGPGGSFQCDKNARCSAAQYLHDKESDVKKIVAFLNPTSDSAAVPLKRESQTRRKALKNLLAEGPIKFDKGGCRAIGDAYFAVMCPPGSHVLTTNLVDHVSLCESLGKEAKKPSAL